MKEGYNVRTTVRSEKRENDVRAMIKKGGVEAQENLSFVIADLTKDEGWSEAVKGCDYVLHVASPFPLIQPKNENDLIIPAMDGSLRVLRAAKDAGVKRVVLTSSFAAIGYGYKSTDKPFNEENWTNLDAKVTPYVKSKTLAERAAWDFIEKEGENLELSVVNPVGVMGPALSSDLSTSVEMLKQLLDGKVPRAPNVSFSLVDVRDVALLHIKAMKHPKAKSERFLATTEDFYSLIEIANVLKKNLGKKASKVPTKKMPNLMVKIIAVFMPSLKSVKSELGLVRKTSNKKAKETFNWDPIPTEEAIIAAANSLIEMNLVNN